MREILYSDSLQRKRMLSQNGSQILKLHRVMHQTPRRLFLQILLLHHTYSLLVRSVGFSENLVLRTLLPRKIHHNQNNQILALLQNSIVSSSRVLLYGNGSHRSSVGFSDLRISSHRPSLRILLIFHHFLFLQEAVSVDFLDYYNNSRASSSLIRIKIMSRTMSRKIKIHLPSILLLPVR